MTYFFGNFSEVYISFFGIFIGYFCCGIGQFFGHDVPSVGKLFERPNVRGLGGRIPPLFGAAFPQSNTKPSRQPRFVQRASRLRIKRQERESAASQIQVGVTSPTHAARHDPTA